MNKNAPVSFFHSELVVLLALFCFAPLGLLLLWTSPRFSGNARVMLTAGVLFLAALSWTLKARYLTRQAPRRGYVSQMDAPARRA